MTATALRAPVSRRPAPPRSRLRLVGSRRAASRRLGLPVAVRIAVAFVILVCFAALSVQALVQVGQVRLGHLADRTATAQSRYTEARLGYARASSPDRITARAERLGLRDRSTTRVVTVPGTDAPTDRVPTSSTEGYQTVKPSLDVRP